MPYLCRVCNSTSSYATNIKPENIDDFESVTHFDTFDDALNAQMLVNRATRFTNTEKYAAIEAEFQECKDLIKHQAKRIVALQMSLRGIRESVALWLTSIAIDLVVSRTHRERNENMRPIVQAMHNWLSYKHEDMDDIPF